MNLRFIATIILFSSLGAFGANYYAMQKGQGTTPMAKETLLEKVKRKGTIRCGYYIWPPAFTMDPNTGKMGGLVYDLMEEVGRQLDLKIKWAAEIVHAQVFSDLKNGRYDIACGPYFITPSRAREGSFSSTVLYHPSYLFARMNDKRFDNNYTAGNSTDVRVAILDGEFSSIAADIYFPKSKKVSHPQNLGGPELLLSVADKKADLVISDEITFGQYNKNNAGILRRVSGDPLSVLAAAFPMPLNEPDFKSTIDETINYLHAIGFIEKLYKKYETPETKFLRVSKPYIEAK